MRQVIERLKGILPAIASPCDEQDVFDEAAFAAHVTRLYRQGVNGLYVCGGTGDGYKLAAIHAASKKVQP